MRILNQIEEVKGVFEKSRFLFLIILFSFLVILLRVGYLQLLKGEEFLKRSKNNFILSEKVFPARGDILSRDGKQLATTVPSFRISLVPIFFSKRSEIGENVERMASVLNLSSASSRKIQTELSGCRGRCRYLPLTVKDEMKKEEILALSSYLSMIPGVYISSSYRRVYPFEERAAHITGYVSKITKKELKGDVPYDSESFTGKTGLEHLYESELHGVYGKTFHVIDYMGRKIELPSRSMKETLPSFKPARKGKTLKTTVLSYLQDEAKKAFGDQAGALVVMEVKTGDILTLFSSPGYDPNLLARNKIPKSVWMEYSRSILHPLLNKAIKSTYFPGSTYKVVPAMAGLYHGVITPRTTYRCNGCLVFGRETKCCWNRGGHGIVNLRYSLKSSCDIYYYFLSQELGLKRLMDFSSLFNVGRKTGVDLPGEESGILPTFPWFKLNHHGRKLHKGYLMNLSIGQGDIRMTPLQIASMYATIANDGITLKPKLVKSVVDDSGREEVVPDEVTRVLDIDKSIFKEMMDSLWAVNNEPGGTAYRHIDHTIPRGVGKTGTSQVISNTQRRKIDFLEEDRKQLTEDDALFAAIYPYENPEIVAVAVLEHGGHGGATAAPIVYRILKAYHKKGAIDE